MACFLLPPAICDILLPCPVHKAEAIVSPVAVTINYQDTTWYLIKMSPLNTWTGDLGLRKQVNVPWAALHFRLQCLHDNRICVYGGNFDKDYCQPVFCGRPLNYSSWSRLARTFASCFSLSRLLPSLTFKHSMILTQLIGNIYTNNAPNRLLWSSIGCLYIISPVYPLYRHHDPGGLSSSPALWPANALIFARASHNSLKTTPPYWEMC